MKSKIILLIIILVAAELLHSCTQDEIMPPDPTIQEFIKSSSYKRIKPYLENFGEIDFNLIQHKKITSNQLTFSMLNIPVHRKGKLMGTAVAIPLNSSEFLPFGDSYAINYENYKNFDFATLSGSIEMIDMNYENFTHATIEVVDNKILSWVRVDLPDDLRDKYSSLRKSSTLSNSNYRTLTYTCDYNKNGDIGFYECYRCVQESMDAETSFFCDIPISGWLGCWSVSASFCVILSATY